MGVRLDFRRTLRAIAARLQDANLVRLLAGSEVGGSSVALRVPEQGERPGVGRKRIRLNGTRHKLADLVGRAGVRTGEMLKDTVRRANIKLGRAGFKVIPSGNVKRRWWAFNAGTEHQVKRPISGITDADHKAAAEEIAAAGREQFVKHAQRRLNRGR